MLLHRFALAIVALVGTDAALACSIAPPPPMPAEELPAYRDNQFLDWARLAPVIVEIVALSSASPRRDDGRGRSGKVRILQVLKGDLVPGTKLAIAAEGPSMCGAGGYKKGERGVIVLRSLARPVVFTGFVSPELLAKLRTAGIVR